MQPVTTSISNRQDGKVVTVTISNPTRMNSLNSQLLDAFVATISSLAKDPELRCVIVTGGECTNGPVFSAGADLSEASTFTEAKPAREFINRLHLAAQSLRELPVPVISRVNGHALGGGLVLMIGADLRIATPECQFGMPEVLRGVPSTIESALLPAAVGALRARRLVLLGDHISAQQAESWGLIDRIVPAAELDNAVEEWVGLLLKSGPRALRSQKELMLTWEQNHPREAINAGIWEFGKAFEGGEDAEPRTMAVEFIQRKKSKASKL